MGLFQPAHLLLLLVGLPLYLAPSLVALRRKAAHYEWIALSNVLADATGVGWVVVLIWALYDAPRA